MRYEWIIGRTTLEFKNFFDCRIIGCIGTQPINRLGMKGDDFALFNEFLCPRERLLRNGQYFCDHSGIPVSS